MKTWNVVSAGPSRKDLRSEHLIAGAPTVTVNRAIDIVENGIRVDFAAFSDGPEGCWKPHNLERFIYIQPHIQLWVTARIIGRKVTIHDLPDLRGQTPGPDFLGLISKFLPAVATLALVDLATKANAGLTKDVEITVPAVSMTRLWERELPLCTGLRELPIGSAADVHDDKVYRWAFTLLSALERIWTFEPKLVRILCADMAGSWIPEKSEAECIEAQKGLDRWMHERAALSRSIEKAKKKFPLEVEWVIPERMSVPSPA